jgi:hypothetical protein
MNELDVYEEEMGKMIACKLRVRQVKVASGRVRRCKRRCEASWQTSTAR